MIGRRAIALLGALVALAIGAGVLVAAGGPGAGGSGVAGAGAGAGAGADTGDRRAGQRLLGRVDPRAPVEFTLALRQDRRAVARFLRAVNDPSSPGYRRFISPAQFGRRFGIGAGELARVRARLRAAGLRVTESFPQRTSLRVRGSAAAANRFLGVRLANFADARGQRWRAPIGRPRLPRALAGPVTAATGLDTRPRFRSHAVPATGLTPRVAARAYGVDALHARGLRGQGQTIAIVSYDTFRDEDVAEYDRRMGIRGAPRVERVPVNGGTTLGEGQDEVNLDIDVIRGVAPRAQILNYEAPNNGQPMGSVIDRIVADGRTDVVSISWGACAAAYPRELREQDEPSFAAAAARGVSIFVASGDAGVYDCQHANPADHRVSVDWPSSSPSAIGVGGTLLSLRADGRYLVETGWEDPLSHSGGGGGLSTFYPRPTWQRGPGVQNRFSTGRRQVPDVAAASDPDSGWYVVTRGQQAQIGGTSAAAPFWSGSMLLIGQLARRERAGRLGFVAPMLYRIAARRDSPFNDVTLGGNRGYRATPGWDYATGLGSADMGELSRHVLRELRRG